MSSTLRIKDMPDQERPRERLAERGADALKDAELIAILLRTGSRPEERIHVLDRYTTSKLLQVPTELTSLSDRRGLEQPASARP